MPHQPRAFAIDPPMSEINTTPMIDVMLVLLIMLMMSLPKPTHKVDVDLPNAAKTYATNSISHRLGIDAGGALSWDGGALSDAALGAKLAQLVSDPAKPMLQMEVAAETPYARFDTIIGAVKRAGVTQLGFAGNEAFRGL